MFKQPMLARAYEPSKLEFPVWASPKIDGYRCVISEGKATTRNGKPFRNNYVQLLIGLNGLDGLDGELVIGDPAAPDVYNKSSGVMKTAEMPSFTFLVFDDFTNPEHNFETRFSRAANRVNSFGDACIKILPQVFIQNLRALDEYEATQLELGYEGVMIRKAGSPYKHGRSSVNEGYLLKVKRFDHDEAVIVGFEEQMHNGNPAHTNEAGKTKRSESKDGLYPSGMLGAYIVESPSYSKRFNVSCGSLSHEEKRTRLQLVSGDIGKTLRFKHLPHGAKDVPRHPLFAGFRDQDDLPGPVLE